MTLPQWSCSEAFGVEAGVEAAVDPEVQALAVVENKICESEDHEVRSKCENVDEKGHFYR